MLVPNRHGSSNSYRYGFQGQEKDDELKGEGNSYHAEFWQYDSRISRRWNLDPIVKTHESPYAAFANNPIWFADRNGADTTVFQNGRGNVIIWLNYERSKINYEKQLNQKNWDFIEVNSSLEDAVTILKSYLEENKIELKNVVLRTHGNSGYIASGNFQGINSSTVKKYNENKPISSHAKKFIESLKSISNMISDGGNFCITACQAGRITTEDLGLQLSKVLLSKNNISLFLNQDQSIRGTDENKAQFTLFDRYFSSVRKFNYGFSMFKKDPYGNINRYDLEKTIGLSGNNIDNPWIYGEPSWKWIWE